MPEKIRVEQQAGGAGDRCLMACGFQLTANIRGAPVLPDNGVVDGLAGLPVPNHRGFALICNTDGSHLAVGAGGLAQGVLAHLQSGFPDLLGVVFNPAGLRIDLGEFLLCNGKGAAVFLEQAWRVNWLCLDQCSTIVAGTCTLRCKMTH